MNISIWFPQVIAKLTHPYIQPFAKFFQFNILTSQTLLTLQPNGQLLDLYLVRMPIQLSFLNLVEST